MSFVHLFVSLSVAKTNEQILVKFFMSKARPQEDVIKFLDTKKKQQKKPHSFEGLIFNDFGFLIEITQKVMSGYS